MLIYAADLILPLKILLVVFVVTIIGATIGLKFVRSENKIVCMWLVPIGCLGEFCIDDVSINYHK